MIERLPDAAAVVTEGLTKSFRTGSETVCAVRQASIAVPCGKFVALVGASGSGKSTLLSMIAGLIVPDAGSIRVNGRELVGLGPIERSALRLRDVAVVFQDDNLLEEFTAVENVALPLDAAGVPWRAAATAAREALARVGLSEVADRQPHQMSGGQRQRTGIARALVGHRSVLLADEPTGSLDAENTAQLATLVKSLCRDGLTAIVATHDPIVAAAADVVISMSDGRVAPAASE